VAPFFSLFVVQSSKNLEHIKTVKKKAKPYLNFWSIGRLSNRQRCCAATKDLRGSHRVIQDMDNHQSYEHYVIYWFWFWLLIHAAPSLNLEVCCLATACILYRSKSNLSLWYLDALCFLLWHCWRNGKLTEMKEQIGSERSRIDHDLI
jgi:hypothetical protein